MFVAALGQGVQSDPPAVAFSRKYGLGARRRNPARRQEKDDLFQHALREGFRTGPAGEQPPAVCGHDTGGATPGAEFLRG